MERKTGTCPPAHLTHRRYEKRVFLHPFRADLNKNWTYKKFLRLSKKLSADGYLPIFADLSASLADFAAFLYESHLFIGNDSMGAHFASLLKIDHITIAAPLKNNLWRSGWHQGQEIYAPS